MAAEAQTLASAPIFHSPGLSQVEGFRGRQGHSQLPSVKLPQSLQQEYWRGGQSSAGLRPVPRCPKGPQSTAVCGRKRRQARGHLGKVWAMQQLLRRSRQEDRSHGDSAAGNLKADA